MMTPQQLEEALLNLTHVTAQLRADNESSRLVIAQMRADNESLLRESNSLKSQYLALSQTVSNVVAERDALKQKVLELEAANKKLTDMLWGRRSERRFGTSISPLLNFGDDTQGSAEASSEVLPPEIIEAQRAAQQAYDLAKLAELEARRKARNARQQDQSTREQFPAHLERREVVLDLSDEQKVDLKFFGTKIFERLRFEKPTVYVERIVRHQYVKKDVVDTSDPPIVAAPTLPAIVEGCKYDFSVIAAIVAMKFAFHMSTYREQDYFGQSGWHPSRSTSNDLINYAVACIDPLFAQMSECVMKQSIVLGDATTLTVLLRDELSADDQRSLDNRKKKRHKELAAKLKAKRGGAQPNESAGDGSAKSFAWLYSGLDAPCELLQNRSLVDQPVDADAPVHPPPDFDDPRWSYAPYNIFHWSLTQKNSVIDSHLANFQGTFVGDAAGVNANLAARSGGRIAHQSCNSHTRREFVKAESNDPVLATQMVSMFRQLYAVEYRGALLSAAERLELRQRDAVPIWQHMQSWLEQDEVKRLLPKSDIGQAVGYLRNQWESLRRYLSNGHLPLDNNHSERVIRPLTIGRKNWMFLGSAKAAPGRMKLFSIVSSAQRHCLSIQDYLADIFLKLSQTAQHSPQDLKLGAPLLKSLLPDRWAVTHPQYVNHHRLQEKQLVAENRLYYRLQAGLEGTHPYANSASLQTIAE
ncbi:MAG: transposase [Pirellulaceae bacterium]